MEPSSISKGCVLGGGAFGTALALVLARKSPETQVYVWHLFASEVEVIQQKSENTIYLPGIRLPKNVTFTTNLSEAMNGAEIVLFAIPTQFLRGFLKRNASKFAEVQERCEQQGGKSMPPLVMCSKGLELGTFKFPVDITTDELSSSVKNVRKSIAVLAGPSFAKELGRGQFTAVTIAADDIEHARFVQRQMTLADGTFRSYASTDVIGAEVASAVKNVLAIASGVASGMGMGLNARAALICRGLTETHRLVLALGGSGDALDGLAGVGDLLLTCSSEQSRNFTVGLRLAKGETLAHITSTSAVAEGVPTAKALKTLRERLGISMPLCENVYELVHNGKSPEKCFNDLVHRPFEDEHDVLVKRGMVAKL